MVLDEYIQISIYFIKNILWKWYLGEFITPSRETKKKKKKVDYKKLPLDIIRVRSEFGKCGIFVQNLLKNKITIDGGYKEYS